MPPARRTQLASAVSNIWTYTVADVAADPVLEDVDEEAAVALGADRPVGHEAAVEDVQRPALAAFAPAGVGGRERLGRGPLDDRDELHERGTALVAQEAVDLAPPPWFAAWTVVRTL